MSLLNNIRSWSLSTASLSQMEDKYISWLAIVFQSEALLIRNIQA